MIDNIKFFVLDKERFERDLKNNPLIDLKTSVSVSTGDYTEEYPKVAKHHNLEIRITKTTAYVKGSIHKYYNSIIGLGNHNYNDFSYRQWEIAINTLCEDLNIFKEHTRITNLEYGFNLECDFDPKELVEKLALMYNYKDHNRKHRFNGKGYYKEFEMTDYSLKIYDKSKQYNLADKKLTRIELKIIKARCLSSLGIVTLQEMTNHTFRGLFKRFLYCFNRILIIDSLKPPKDVRIDLMVLFTTCTNPNLWESLSYEDKLSQKRDFKKLIKKYSYDKVHTQLRDKILSKYHKLIK
ncbi:MAG: hypothetical protein R2816_02880 [Flavobacteriaceae bacterium]|nr:hypothetical protein [Flavobacteriaceae bacterium]